MAQKLDDTHITIALEQILLASLLRRPGALDEVARLVQPEDFYSDANACIYRQMLMLHEEGKRLDQLLLRDRLRRAGEFDALGGDAFLGQLIYSVSPTESPNPLRYAWFVHYRAKSRHEGVVLQAAVLVPGGRTDEGVLIQAVAPAWFEIIRLLKADPDLVFRIDPRQWEELIAGAYERAGFDEVTLTPRSGDRGRDVIAVRKGFWSVRIIEQVKAYRPGHLVTANDVRALVGVLHSDGNASKGVVTTTSDFAPRIRDDPDIARQMPYRLELVNGEQLLDRLSELADLGTSD